MKEVFVLYGRKWWHDGVFSGIFVKNIYFDESPVLEVFDNFNAGFVKFQEHVTEALESFRDGAPMSLDEECVKKALEANPFEAYNMNLGGVDDWSDEDEDEGEEVDIIEGDVQWKYSLTAGESAHWQMYAVAPDITFDCPILPGLHLERKTVNS